jgi:hypothetical protein
MRITASPTKHPAVSAYMISAKQEVEFVIVGKQGCASNYEKLIVYPTQCAYKMETLFENLSMTSKDNSLSSLSEIVSKLDIQSLKLMINNTAYNIGTDSKLVSKMIEIYVCDFITKACSDFVGMKVVTNTCQNSYPDCIIYVGDDAYAVDIKTTYLVNKNKVNGFTLGTYKGYFRDRTTTKNCMRPYNSFKSHLCICTIYERIPDGIVIKHTLLTHKWRIASKKPGSGNTTNIGSLTTLQDILHHKALFVNESEFDDYWQAYSPISKRND